MATWGEIRNYINSNYQVSDDDGDVLTLVFNSQTGNRTQMVVVTYLDLEDPLVIFQSPFAAVSQVSAGKVLDLAAGLPFGIASTGEFYVVKHVQYAATADGPEIDLPLAFVSGSADELEQALGLADQF